MQNIHKNITSIFHITKYSSIISLKLSLQYFLG